MTCRVQIDGQPLKEHWAARLVRVSIDQRMEAADRFTLLFGESGRELFDAEIFVPGARVEIDCDPNPGQTPLILAEVVAATPEFVAGSPITLQVEGYDGAYRLSRQRKQQTFLDMTAGEIARKIGSDAGLRVEAEDGDRHEYVIQDNLSDMEFLVRLARRERFEVAVDFEKLRFGKPAEGGQPDVTLTLGQNLLQFTPLQNAARQPAQVIVRGWNPTEKKAVVGRAGTGDEDAAVGRGKKSGDLMTEAFGDAGTIVVERPVKTERDAEQAARRLLSELAMRFVQIQASTPGDAAIRAGRLVTLRGVGPRYEGDYYVVEATHSFTPRGYVTQLLARRNALEELESPPEESPAESPAEEPVDIEAMLVDPLGESLADTPYKLRLADGTVREGRTDDQGGLLETGCPPGPYRIEAGDLDLSVIERKS